MAGPPRFIVSLLVAAATEYPGSQICRRLSSFSVPLYFASSSVPGWLCLSLERSVRTGMGKVSGSWCCGKSFEMGEVAGTKKPEKKSPELLHP